MKLQQSLPFTVCAEGCEAAEEQSDDEVRTSQVPERSEGKTKVIKQQSLPFTVLKLNSSHDKIPPCGSCNSTYRLRYWNSFIDTLKAIRFPWLVATVLTVYGMRRRVRDSRGAERRWGPHISYLNEVRLKRRRLGNSTYRLRYWNIMPITAGAASNIVAIALTVYGIETK